MWPLDHRQTDNPACMSRVLFQTCEMKVSKDHVSDSWQMTSRLNQQPCLTSVSRHCRPAWPASVGIAALPDQRQSALQTCLTSVSRHCSPAWPASVGFTFTVLCVLDQCTAFSHTTYMSISPQIWQRKLFVVKCRQLSRPADLCSVFSPYTDKCVSVYGHVTDPRLCPVELVSQSPDKPLSDHAWQLPTDTHHIIRQTVNCVHITTDSFY